MTLLFLRGVPKKGRCLLRVAKSGQTNCPLNESRARVMAGTSPDIQAFCRCKGLIPGINPGMRMTTEPYYFYGFTERRKFKYHSSQA